MPVLPIRSIAVAAGAAFLLAADGNHAVTVVVPDTSNPWLAGMPDSTNAIGKFLSSTSLKFINPTGDLSHTDICPGGCTQIDSSTLFSHSGNDEFGISALRAPINVLPGDFLGPGLPDSSATPEGLDFTPLPELGTDFSYLPRS